MKRDELGVLFVEIRERPHSKKKFVPFDSENSLIKTTLKISVWRCKEKGFRAELGVLWSFGKSKQSGKMVGASTNKWEVSIKRFPSFLKLFKLFKRRYCTKTG